MPIAAPRRDASLTVAGPLGMLEVSRKRTCYVPYPRLKGTLMNVSVIFASPSTRNAGMAAVDSAWDNVRHAVFEKDTVQKYRFDCISYDGGDHSEYKCLTKHLDEVLSSDVIVYWGDFLHMRHYHERKAKQLVSKGAFPTVESARDFVQRSLLLKGASDQVLGRTISFGTNQLLESTSEFLEDAEHRQTLERFIRSVHSFFPRDLYSNHLASYFRNKQNDLGCDAALGVWDPPAITPLGENPSIGIFFGRSRSGLLGRLLFALTFSRMLRGRMEWIEWIDKRERYDRIVKSAFLLACRNRKTQFHDNEYKAVANFDLILTDTYHLAVNGWAAGVPTICIGNTTERLRGSGAKFAWNDKRFMFYQMMFGHEFFVHSHECSRLSKLRSRQRHLIKLLNDTDAIQFVSDSLQHFKTQAFQALEKDLKTLRMAASSPSSDKTTGAPRSAN